MYRFSKSLLVLSAFAATAGAQRVNRVADSLVRRGALERAESLYYADARARPRDPQARYALGQFLWGRGAARIGATLLDEAKQFGGPRAQIDSALSRIYFDLGEYAAIAALRSEMSVERRRLIDWLVTHPTRASAPDSGVLVAFTRTPLDGYLGAVRLRVNGYPIVAQVWPRAACGLSISDTSAAMAKLRTFSKPVLDTTPAVLAVADSVGFGRMTMTNMPVTAMKLRDGVQATICLGTLMKYAPTFDPKANLMTLHLGGTVPRARASNVGLPFFVSSDGIFSVSQSGALMPLALPQMTAMLRDRRWTIDTRRGLLVLEP
jgi:hypothetical protein